MYNFKGLVIMLILLNIFLFINTSILLYFYNSYEKSRGCICNKSATIKKILLETFKYQIIPIAICLLNFIIYYLCKALFKIELKLSLYQVFNIFTFMCYAFLVGDLAYTSFAVLRFILFLLIYFSIQYRSFKRHDIRSIESAAKITSFIWSMALVGVINQLTGFQVFFYQG